MYWLRRRKEGESVKTKTELRTKQIENVETKIKNEDKNTEKTNGSIDKERTMKTLVHWLTMIGENSKFILGDYMCFNFV